MLPDLSAIELLTTTRSVRKRLDLSRPVERRVVDECVRHAFQAPNGSNQQTWNWVLVDDVDIKAKMAGIYRASLADHIAASRQSASRAASTKAAAPAAAAVPTTTGSEHDDASAAQRMTESVMYLAEHLQDVPVLLVPTAAGRLDGSSIFQQASVWGSILPAVWNLMLSLRVHGLGSAWTTLHLHREREMAELLGIPLDSNTQAGLFPIAYTLGTSFRRADRSKSDASIRWNGW